MCPRQGTLFFPSPASDASGSSEAEVGHKAKQNGFHLQSAVLPSLASRSAGPRKGFGSATVSPTPVRGATSFCNTLFEGTAPTLETRLLGNASPTVEATTILGVLVSPGICLKWNCLSELGRGRALPWDWEVAGGAQLSFKI